jgi:uncharacterized protein DUF1326
MILRRSFGGKKMRRFWIGPIFLAVLAVFCGAVTLSSQGETVAVRGDYVEVRTASVFAGACHYNGELTTTGRDALMAWNVKSGQWHGVDLAGVRVVAIVSSEANLSDNDAARQTEIIVGENASDAQTRAILEAIRNKYAATLGKVVSVRRGPLTFEHKGRTYAVNSDNASINVEGMPDDLCCKMPQLVWYSPLVALENRKVGYTTKAIYKGEAAGEAWQRSGENSAFYGSFAF